jgi:FkbM family methyltransferase
MLKSLAQRLARVRIYRDQQLPWGLDFGADAARRAPEVPFRNVFDVGANVGQSALRFRQWFPNATIWSFEPFEGAFQELEDAVRGSNVRCFKLAMAEEPGMATAALAGLSVNNSLLNVPEDLDADAVETVELSTLDAFTAERGVDRIDFLKVDTEGYDLKVLEGAERLLRAAAVTFIQVEAGMNPHNAKHVPLKVLQTHLEARGYTLFALYEQTPEWSGEARLRFANATFVTETLATRPTG